MQALILALILSYACQPDHFKTGHGAYMSENVLKNDTTFDRVTKFNVSGQYYNLSTKIILLDTGTIMVKYDGSLSFVADKNFKGSFYFTYFALDGEGMESGAIAEIKMVKTKAFPDKNRYYYEQIIGNTKKYYLLVRRIEEGEIRYYYDTGLLLFPLPEAVWKKEYRKKRVKP